ncbi:MAG: OmpH family outer membrane protein [Desulfobulbus sp.]|nr:OmpH family outer membrane protein [Desulfobulbus sp.]
MATIFCLQSHVTLAADTKIAVIDMKEVLSASTAGKKAQDIIEKKMKSLQASFKADETSLVNMQKDMEKKGSAWSDSVKREKAMEFQQKRRALAEKQDKANQELKKLREQNVNPILKKLEDIVGEVASAGGYSVVLPRNVVLYSANSVDITGKIIDELNKVIK